MTACPQEAELAAFVAGRAVEPGAIRAHIGACGTCRSAVAALVRQETSQVAPTTMVSRRNDADTTTVAATPARAGAGIFVAGDKVGRYVIERELGRGGMGVVFAARDPSLERKVALKIVRPDDDDPTAGLRMAREARAMAKLSHPNVVTLHDVGELPDGEIFLAMELVDGGSLRSSLRGRPLPQILDVFLQAARGLAAAHDVGLIHRDFKPDNVLVGNDGRVRVGDFGLVRGSDDAPMNAAGALTQFGSILGTPGYMAPEQHLGLHASEKADQYAFAIALYEAIAGQRPFAGSYEEIQAAKLTREPPPLPPEARVPAAVGALFRRAFERQPEWDPLESTCRHASLSIL